MKAGTIPQKCGTWSPKCFRGLQRRMHGEDCGNKSRRTGSFDITLGLGTRKENKKGRGIIWGG